MHASVLNWVEEKRNGLGIDGWDILEVGALDVNGSPRSLFQSARSYIGVDMRLGPGVDVVANGHKLAFAAGAFDLVLYLEVIEHDVAFWLTLKEIGRVLKPGGFLMLTGRGNCFPLHGYPDDYWRFLPSAFRELLQLASCEVTEVVEDGQPDHPGSFALGRRRAASNSN